MPEGYWHHMTYITAGFTMSIRSVARNKINFLKAVYNVFFMRYFDNFMRKIRKQKWIAYKNTEAIRKTHQNIKNL